jgi:NAD+ synthase (glutamine-hydrolysing)
VKERTVEDYDLEQIVRDLTGQVRVPFGDAALFTKDTSVGTETCGKFGKIQERISHCTSIG